MKITKKWLKEKDACDEGYKWFINQKETDLYKLFDALVADNHWDWANWTIVRVMNRPQYLKYAIFSAEQVIRIYEKKYPNNKAPRTAIDAAKAVLKNDTQENRDAAYTAYAYTAYAAAAYAAYAAYAYTAYTAAYAAYAAADAAAADAYATARQEMRKRILDYGISLLKENT